MNYSINLNKPNKYLAHWQCQPNEWRIFGKAQWEGWLFPLIGISSCSYLLVYILWNTFKKYQTWVNEDGLLLTFLIVFIGFSGISAFLVFLIQVVKSDYLFYKKRRIKPVDIYIDCDRVIIDNRKYEVKDWYRLKIGNPSVLVLDVLSYRKGFSREIIYVPVPKECELEALKLIEILVQK